MRLESSVSLAVAVLDLKLVQLLRGAMRAADANGHDCRDLLGPRPLIEPRRRFHPEPTIEPRPHIHPEPKFEPRPVHRPEEVRPALCPPAADVSAAGHKSSPSPIQPPWKVLPWQDAPAERPRPIHKVKVVIGPPDMCSKGNVIDLFI